MIRGASMVNTPVVPNRHIIGILPWQSDVRIAIINERKYNRERMSYISECYIRVPSFTVFLLLLARIEKFHLIIFL